jgi:membrane-associated protein
MLLMTLAAALGNTTNYAIGRAIGQRAFSGRSRFIKVQYLRQTEAWFARYGAMTVLLSRFAPIVRTFAPFIAGVGRMPYATFQAWNVAGAVAWVGLFVWGGYFVGNIPLIRDNFGVVTLVVIAVSLLPLLAMLLKRSRVAE